MLGEVDVHVPVPKGTRGRDLAVVIQKKKLSLGLKGAKDKILEGELCKEIKVEDSTWTLGEFYFLSPDVLDTDIDCRGRYGSCSHRKAKPRAMVGERSDSPS